MNDYWSAATEGTAPETDNFVTMLVGIYELCFSFFEEKSRQQECFLSVEKKVTIKETGIYCFR